LPLERQRRRQNAAPVQPADADLYGLPPPAARRPAPVLVCAYARDTYGVVSFQYRRSLPTDAAKLRAAPTDR